MRLAPTGMLRLAQEMANRKALLCAAECAARCVEAVLLEPV